jgi:hypothetical protein
MPDATRQSPSPLLASPGAVAADPPDEGVAAHYGNPHTEQRALAAGDGYVDPRTAAWCGSAARTGSPGCTRC